MNPPVGDSFWFDAALPEGIRGITFRTCGLGLLLAAALGGHVLPALSQGAVTSPELQQKIATLKQSLAQNQQALRQYTGRKPGKRFSREKPSPRSSHNASMGRTARCRKRRSGAHLSRSKGEG